MTGLPIVTPFATLNNWLRGRLGRQKRPDLHSLWLHPEMLPSWVADSPPVLRTLDLLGPLHWERFPERDLQRNWGQTTVPYAAFAAAYLVKLNEGRVYMSNLCDYLLEHPALIWLLDFPLVSSPATRWGFDAEASLPTQRHLTRMLKIIPNAALQFLLDETVAAIRAELAALRVTGVGDCISLDTKHVIAWVKENNPKTYVPHRFDKTQQPAGDPDCKLGCKRRHNQRTTTPLHNPVPANTVGVGEYYWGYGSGVVATKVPGWGEFVLAELTQPFDAADVSYFFPLMAQTEARLGFRPRCGAFDAAFDAFYVYEYFHRQDDPGAFAAVPFVKKGGYTASDRLFDQSGLVEPSFEGIEMALMKMIKNDHTII